MDLANGDEIDKADDSSDRARDWNMVEKDVSRLVNINSRHMKQSWMTDDMSSIHKKPPDNK